MRRIALLAITILVSCTGGPDKEPGQAVKKALAGAGENRSELERVLEHYSHDPADELKLRAAEYLVSNMPGHFSMTDATTAGYYSKTLEQYPDLKPARKVAIFSLPQFYISSIGVTPYDIDHIEADFLIRHIDYLFDIAGQRLASGEMPFDIFCKHLLPYRIASEPLSYLMRGDIYLDPRSFDEYRKFDLDYEEWFNGVSLLYDRTAYDNMHRFSLPFPVGGEVSTGDCILGTLHAKKKYDLVGIPSAIFFTPHHHNKNGRHYWIGKIGDTGDIQKAARRLDDAAKVYIFTYERRERLVSTSDEYVPLEFLFTNLEDVTSLAREVSDVAFSLKGIHGRPQYAYLAVFNEMEWRPVAWAECKNGKVRFKDMGRGVVYQPVYYKGHAMKWIDYPFLVTGDGETKRFVPDHDNLQSIRIDRKYPYDGVKVDRILGLQSLRLLASNDKSFDSCDTLGRLEYQYGKPFYSVPLEGTAAFRYLRLIPVAAGYNSYNGVSEIIFYDRQNNRIATGPADGNGREMFDNDLLTNHYLSRPLDIELQQSISPARMEIYPQTDENDIYPGDTYELFYAGADGWKSLGVQVAVDYFVEYEGVPRGALLWLHNHTKGTEERPFTHENGKLRFY